MTDPSAGTGTKQRRGRRLTLHWRRVTLLVIALLFVGLAVFVVEAWRAYASLQHARDDVAALQAEVGGGDLAAARSTSHQLSSHARAAHDASDGWLWDLAARLPLMGPDVKAVQVVSHALDDLAGDPLRDSLDLLSRLQGGEFVPKNGRLDLARYERATPLVTRVATAVDDARARIGEVRPQDLLGPLGDVISRLQSELDSVDTAAGAARTAVRLVPDLMGGSAPRSILLVVQNNAEIRATAGLPGSFTFLTARSGRLAIGPHYSTSDLPPLRRPAAILTSDERRLFGPTLATDVRDSNLMPDFPRAARAAQRRRWS